MAIAELENTRVLVDTADDRTLGDAAALILTPELGAVLVVVEGGLVANLAVVAIGDAAEGLVVVVDAGSHDVRMFNLCGRGD